MCENCRTKHIVLSEKITLLSWLNLHNFITNVKYLELHFIDRILFSQTEIQSESYISIKLLY